MPRTATIALACLAACSAPPTMKKPVCETPNVPVRPPSFPVDADLGAEVKLIVGNGFLSECQPFIDSASVEVSDPDNLPVAAQVDSVTHIGAQLSAAIRFTPKKLGFHHVVVTFGNGSVAQREVVVLRPAKAGTPDALPVKCARPQPLPEGWLCFAFGWHYARGGTGVPVTSSSGAAAAAGAVAWVTDASPTAHFLTRFVERDGGLFSDPAPLPLSGAIGGSTLLPTETDAILVGPNDGWQVGLADGGLVLNPATAGADPSATLTFRDGDGYVAFSQSFPGKPGLCRYGFAGAGACVNLPGTLAGLSRDGAWTYANNTLTLSAFDGTKKADLGVGELKVWPSSTTPFNGGAPWGLPLVGRTDASTFAGTAVAVPVLTDAGLVLERVPVGPNALVGASDTAFWWDGAALRR